mgnify:CR=1 FL=1
MAAESGCWPSWPAAGADKSLAFRFVAFYTRLSRNCGCLWAGQRGQGTP